MLKKNIKRSLNRQSYKPRGYTLIELTLSTAMLTFIAVLAMTSFVGVFGTYNKAQSLTRTQQDTRDAIDQLTRDLRLSYTVDYYPGRDTTYSVTNFNPARSQATVPIAAKDFYCLRNEAGDFEIGYALVYSDVTRNYNVFRSESCRDYSQAQRLTSPDVWNDKGAKITGAPGSTDGPAADANDLPGAVLSDPSSRRPLIISQVPGTDPKVWFVRLSTFKGSTIPGLPSTNLRDPFGAQTTLQSVVTTRQ